MSHSPAASVGEPNPLKLHTVFDDRYFMASNELNLLNTLLGISLLMVRTRLRFSALRGKRTRGGADANELRAQSTTRTCSPIYQLPVVQKCDDERAWQAGSASNESWH